MENFSFRALDQKAQKILVGLAIDEFFSLCQNQEIQEIQDMIFMIKEEFLKKYLSYQFFDELDKKKDSTIYDVAFFSSLPGFTGFCQKIQCDNKMANILAKTFADIMQFEITN